MKPRKGVSEILATMIVLMIVSSLGVMLYSMSTSTLGSQETNLLSQVETQKETAQEKFQIISITRVDNNTIQIYYLDYGTVSPVISSVYLEYVGKTPGAGTQLINPSIKKVTQCIINNKPSNIYYLTVNVSKYLTNNNYVTYMIVSQRGNSNESQA